MTHGRHLQQLVASSWNRAASSERQEPGGIYCWHVSYSPRRGGFARPRTWLESELGPLLRGSSDLEGAVLSLARDDRLVLDTWWTGREAVERLLVSAAFRRERRRLVALDLLAAEVDTLSHEPCCPLAGQRAAPPAAHRVD